jgi:hypothetical protein
LREIAAEAIAKFYSSALETFKALKMMEKPIISGTEQQRIDALLAGLTQLSHALQGWQLWRSPLKRVDLKSFIYIDIYYLILLTADFIPKMDARDYSRLTQRPVYYK